MPKDLNPLLAEEERRGIRSVEVAMRLLDVLASADSGLPLKTLSSRAGMAPSKAHRYLASFIRGGLVRQDPASGHYDLGDLALRLGLAAIARNDAIERAAEKLHTLMVESGFTAALYVWAEQGPTMVRWQRMNVPFVAAVSLGSIAPLSTSATGRAMLAHLPTAVTAPLLARERELAPDRALSDTALDSILKEVRATGLASADSTYIPGLSAVSAAVLDWQNECVCALTLLGPDGALARAKHPARDILLQVTGELSRSNGAKVSVHR